MAARRPMQSAALRLQRTGRRADIPDCPRAKGRVMNGYRNISRAVAALGLGAAVFLPQAARAQEVDPWQWRGSAYLWLSSIESATRFPSGATGPTIDVDAGDILSRLKLGFMGTLEGHKGRWGVWTDVIYLDAGDTATSTRNFTLNQGAVPASATGNFSLDLKSWLWTMAGTYALVAHADYESRALFGARMSYVRQTLDWTLTGSAGATALPAVSGRSEVSDTAWDAIAGVTGVVRIGADRRWVVPYYIDVGAGQSKLTWQAAIGLGYAFDWGTVTGAWRYLDYEYKAGYPLESMTLSGPYFGLTFRW
jgi:hypothetical protein